jgi:hypothetical protein
MSKKQSASRSARPAGAQGPDCHRCKEKLVIPNAKTWREFLKLAEPIYRATRPQREKAKRPRGRPFDPNSTFAKLANELVRKEVTRLAAKTKALPAVVIDRWASSPDTVNDLTKKLEEKLWDKNPNDQTADSTIRRHVRLALLEVKSFTAVTDEEDKFQAKRQLRANGKLHTWLSLHQLLRKLRDKPTSHKPPTKRQLTLIRQLEHVTSVIQQHKKQRDKL